MRSPIDEVRDAGYAVIRGFLPAESLPALNQSASRQLAHPTAPLELEADLHYPGAPPSRSAAGGQTPRRFLDAYHRDPEFARWATTPVRGWMEEYFGERVAMSTAHHNCLMTKHPRYGSMTGWHRDIRFWSFGREDLVSVWMALGEECIENGGLWFVPGSHRRTFESDRFDAGRFFRADHPENRPLLETAEAPRLAPGDAVLFHSNTLHSAGPNLTDQVKFSLVYTYHGRSNPPVPGTRSAAMPEIEL